MAVDTTTYKVRLEEMLAELTEELQTIGVHDPENPDNWTEKTTDLDLSSADVNDVADRTEEWEERRGIVATLETRYNNIRRALSKIETGTFGICEISGDEIEVDRLDANPAARTCKLHMNDESTLPN